MVGVFRTQCVCITYKLPKQSIHLMSSMFQEQEHFKIFQNYHTEGA